MGKFQGFGRVNCGKRELFVMKPEPPNQDKNIYIQKMAYISLNKLCIYIYKV